MQGTEHRRSSVRVLDAALIVLLLLTAWRLFASQPAAKDDELGPPLAAGSHLDQPELWYDTTESRFAVLLLSTTCSACNDNAAFYRILAAESHRLGDVGFAVISNEDPKVVAKWLSSHQIRADKVLELRNPSTSGFTAFPTLLLVDRPGKVTDVLVHRLQPEQQSLVISRLKNSKHGSPLDNTYHARELDVPGWRELAAKNPTTVLDIRSLADAKSNPLRLSPSLLVMPFEEIPARATAELPKEGIIGIGCTVGSLAKCRAAGRRLIDRGFDDVVVIRLVE